MIRPIIGAVLAIVLFAATAPAMGRRLAPSLATRLLVPATLVMAASTVFVLGALASPWLGQLPIVSAIGKWSVVELDAVDPVPDAVSEVSVVLLLVVAGHVTWHGIRRIRELVAIYRTGRAFRDAGPLVVLDSERPDAFTTPAPAARVVVTAGLMRALTRTERRVVLAHERSHLNHQHVWWTLAADLAAAVNPLLRPVATTVAQAVERWADEDAAVIVGDRTLVARTIARAALLQHGSPALAASATGGDVPHRVRAMLAPPPRRRPLMCMALAVLLVAGTVATVAVEQTGDQVFDDAHGHTTGISRADH